MQILVKTRRGVLVSQLMVDSEELVIGRNAEAGLRLNGWKVSVDHAAIYRDDARFFVRDRGSRTGTFVDGEKVTEFGPLSKGNRIGIGDYLIEVAHVESAVRESVSPAGVADPAPVESAIPASAVEEPVGQHGGAAPPLADAAAEFRELERRWKRAIHQRVISAIDLRRIDVSALDDESLRAATGQLIGEVVAGMGEIPGELDREQLGKQVLEEAVGLGPIEDLLARADVSEVMVNAFDEVYYEANGTLCRSGVTFMDDSAVISAIERIVAPLGRRIDESSPMVDARLKDGSRVNAIIPPLAIKGPCITIRKFMKEKLTAGRLVGFGSLDAAMVRFLEIAVRQKLNIVIAGGTGSGKTTLLNVLSGFIPESERIVTIEDAAELRLHQPHIVSLESRPANQEGKGAVGIRDLVRNSLRMRPDRIVVGECRGGEALDMLQAMNTGHDGSLTTVHANSPRDCISRLEVLVLMSGMDLPVMAIREQIASAIHLIVQQTRFSCGSRKITSVSEVTGIEGSVVQLAEIFRFRQLGYGPDGRVRGRFEATGLIPEFCEQMSERGVDIDLAMFDRGRDDWKPS
jgi:pilus assembly protein CpaF